MKVFVALLVAMDKENLLKLLTLQGWGRARGKDKGKGKGSG